MSKKTDIEQLRAMSKPELAVALANTARAAVCPDDKWTLKRGRDAIEVLLIAASMVYPTSKDIETLGKNNTITDTAVKLADEIDVIKEEARQADEQV